MPEPREPMPEEIRRTVRKRCGFGCVVCGNPIVEYDHLYGYKKEVGHIADEITLLCGHHHTKKTNGLIALETILQYNEKPHNVVNSQSAPDYFDFQGKDCTIWVGSNYVWSPLSEGQGLWAIGIDGVGLLGFGKREGRLVLQLRVLNEFNEVVLRIENNELVYHNPTDTWDITLEGKVLKVREGNRKYLLEIEFDMPSAVKVRRARFLLNGVEVVVRRNGLVVVGNMTIGSSLTWGTDGGAFLLVGTNWEKSQMPKISRYNRRTVATEEWETELREASAEQGDNVG